MKMYGSKSLGGQMFGLVIKTLARILASHVRMGSVSGPAPDFSFPRMQPLAGVVKLKSLSISHPRGSPSLALCFRASSPTDWSTGE